MKADLLALPRAGPIPARWRDPFTLTVAGTTLLLALLSVYPTAMLFYGSLTTAPLGQAGTVSLANYARAYGDPEMLAVLRDSFGFALGASVLSLVLASALAWVTIRTNAPLRGCSSSPRSSPTSCRRS